MALTKVKNAALPTIEEAKIPVLTASKIPTLTSSNMPSGSVVQHYQSPLVGGDNQSSTHIGIAVPAYGSNKSNFRAIPSTYDISFTTKEANSHFLFTGHYTLGNDTTSHAYIDVYMYHNGTGQGWLADLAQEGTSANDGLVSIHKTSASDFYTKSFAITYKPNLPAGTTILGKLHVGNWIATTVRINSYAGGGSNNNQNCQSGMQVFEIKQ